MYLIQLFRFGSWTVRCLNWALIFIFDFVQLNNVPFVLPYKPIQTINYGTNQATECGLGEGCPCFVSSNFFSNFRSLTIVLARIYFFQTPFLSTFLFPVREILIWGELTVYPFIRCPGELNTLLWPFFRVITYFPVYSVYSFRKASVSNNRKHFRHITSLYYIVSDFFSAFNA